MDKLRQQDVKLLNALALAYMGDAVLEQRIREHLLLAGGVKPHRLHKEATNYVSAKAQSNIVHRMIEEAFLTEDELAVFRRGRNAKSGSVPKNTDVRTYKNSSGFEAILGYLFLLEQHERVNAIIDYAIEIVEQTKGA